MVTTAAIPEFFYARYGYAVETLASALMPETVGAYAIETQYATGATRPDFVVWNAKKEDVAWLDITSSGSAGHILAKQHTGWSTRPYVAEILYDPPTLGDFTKGSGLSDEHKKAFAAIENKAVEEELDYQTGYAALGAMLENALIDAAKESDDKVTKSGTKAAVWKAMKGPYPSITAEDAGQVLRAIDRVTVGKTTDTGANWANWAFDKQGYKSGRAYIIDYGRKLRKPATTTSSSSNSNSNSNSSSSSSATNSNASSSTATSVATPTTGTTTTTTATTTTTTTTDTKSDVAMSDV